MSSVDSLEKFLMLGKIEVGGEGKNRRWDGWMASLTQWTWVWVSSESWWWTGKPGMLQSMGSQRVGHDCMTELNWGFPVLYHLPDLLKLISIEFLMLSNHFILCHPLLFLLAIFPSIRVFSNELALHIRWPKYWSWYIHIYRYRSTCMALSLIPSKCYLIK